MVDAAGTAEASLRVVVVFAAAPRQVREWSLCLVQGASVSDALRAAGLESSTWPCGIWGRAVERGQLLCDGDRVELYRPLLVDPKVARRERFARQGARGAGLFARQRPGAKAGY